MPYCWSSQYLQLNDISLYLCGCLKLPLGLGVTSVAARLHHHPPQCYAPMAGTSCQDF